MKILDSTLREGEQTPGVYFDQHVKLLIAELLSEIGIDIIEAGHPIVSTSIKESVRNIAGHKLINSVVGAHARSIERDIDVALECGVGFIGVFYCVSDERISGIFKSELSKSIEQISKVIEYAKKNKPGLILRYTPEDTVRSNFENVVNASIEAVNAGADIISVADTTGYMIPRTENNYYDYIIRLKEKFSAAGINPQIAVHCHNDRGFALANVQDAIAAGVEIVDATVLGLGERAGITDLAQILSLLKIDLGYKNEWNLKKLVELYRLVSKYSGVSIPVNHPILGTNAFTHCAGVHTHAAAINPAHYQSLDPKIFDREMNVSLDHMSGLASVKYSLEKVDIEESDKDILVGVLEYVKSIGEKGRVVEINELKHIYNLVLASRSF
jgi:2-isopropylmalate synthase